MASPLTMTRVRQQLGVVTDDSDELIFGLIAAATRSVEIHTGMTFADGPNVFTNDDAEVAAQAALMLVTTWFDNRDSIAANGTATELPLAVTWLLWPLKRLSV